MPRPTQIKLMDFESPSRNERVFKWKRPPKVNEAVASHAAHMWVL
jgi:hypothetical protein